MNYVRVGGYIPPQPIEDYNDLPNIPVISQDLTASGFTPIANTYYKHTGATTASYTNGVIYYYNSTGYIALDGSAYGLATVAKTGSYNDLSNKPTIPDAANNGTLTIQKNGTNVATFGANQSTNTTANITVPTKASDIKALPISGGSITGDLTVGGNLTINGTTTTVDSTTLQVKDKLIEVAHGNTTTLTTPAGLVAPKYDGTNSGALVFDSTGTAYVGDVTLKDGNIDVANSGLQPLATRTGLVGGNLVQYDSSALTLKDSGKKISDLATTSQVNAKYTKPSGGIPKTDLASDVQTSLGKADSALQAKDISGKANLSGGNTFTGKQTLTNPASDGYSIDANGYVKGSWLQSSATSNKGSNTGKVCVFDNNGLIYYRTPSEILAEAGGAKANDIPTDYVKYTAQTLTQAQKSQARSNIGAGTSNFDGTWGSLSGKPNVVQSTGNSTSDVMSQNAVTNELNKKANSADLATVATSGSYNDLNDKPTNYVTTDTTQTISGNKTFTAQPIINTSNGLKFTSGNCALRIYNTSASPTDYSAIEVRSNSSSTNRNLFIDLDNNSLVVGQASGTADTTYKVNVKDSFNATTIYENGTPLTNKYALKTDIPTDYVKYTAQTLTDAQKSQARSNIGAGTSNFSGNYNDLTNPPKIPTFSLSGTTLTITTN